MNDLPRKKILGQIPYSFTRRKLLVNSMAIGSMGIASLLDSQSSSVSARDRSNDHKRDFQEVTERSKRSIAKATKWILSSINPDGGIGLDKLTATDVACTGVTGLALMSQGNTTTTGPLHKPLKKLSEYLLTATEKMTSGQLQYGRSQIEGDLGRYATHYFALIYLSSAIGESNKVDRYKEAIRRIERYVSGGQQPDGSWGTNAWAPLLATACGWISLRTANFAGVTVSGSSKRSGAYLIKKMPKLGGSWNRGNWYHRLYGTAAGLRVLYALGQDQHPKAQQALADVMDLVTNHHTAFGGAGGEEYLTFHLLTDMLLQKGGKQWEKWYPVVRDKLVQVQNRDGSWTGHHCITSRTFSTACALLVLNAPNRFVPIYQG